MDVNQKELDAKVIESDKELDLQVIGAAEKLVELNPKTYADMTNLATTAKSLTNIDNGKDFVEWWSDGRTKLTEESLNELLSELGMAYEIKTTDYSTKEWVWCVWDEVGDLKDYKEGSDKIKSFTEIPAMKKRMCKEIMIQAVSLYEKEKSNEH